VGRTDQHQWRLVACVMLGRCQDPAAGSSFQLAHSTLPQPTPELPMSLPTAVAVAALVVLKQAACEEGLATNLKGLLGIDFSVVVAVDPHAADAGGTATAGVHDIVFWQSSTALDLHGLTGVPELYDFATLVEIPPLPSPAAPSTSTTRGRVGHGDAGAADGAGTSAAPTVGVAKSAGSNS
jgi:hypothetical protein